MAALLCLLIHAPVRISNASQLCLDGHITRMKKGPLQIWLLEWKEFQVKNKVTLRHELPASCTELLERYCSVHRPRLLKEPRPELFIGQSGGKKSSSALSKQLAAFIARETGIVFHAHLIRHLMAYLYLKQHPGDYVTVQRLLGHKSLETTLSFYAGLEAESDHVVYDQMIANLRVDGRGRQSWEDRL